MKEIREREKLNEFTYVGAGDTPPQMINFMGKQVFLRGEPQVVTDPVVLAKVKTNRSFVAGRADKDKMFAGDLEAKKEAERCREEDTKTQIWVERNNHKLS